MIAYEKLSNEELICEHANAMLVVGHRDQPRHLDAIETEMLRRMRFSSRNAMLASVVGERMHDLIRVYYPIVSDKTEVVPYHLGDPYAPLFTYSYYPKPEDVIPLDPEGPGHFQPKMVERRVGVHTIMLEDQVVRLAYLPELDQMVVFVR